MLIYMDHIKKLQCQCLPTRITKEEAPGDLGGGGGGEWSQGIYAPNSLPVKSPWLSDLNDSLLLLPEAGSHLLLFFWVHGQQRPRFPYHPSLFPQYSTYIFITELFTSKPPSVYSNSRVPSVSYRISTWHTLVYREHSMVPQKKWSKISSYHWILLIHRTPIWCSATFFAIMSKYGSSQSRNVWTQHIFCSLLIIEWWKGNKMNINKQEQWKTGSIHLSTLSGKTSKDVGYADYYLIRHGFCPGGRTSYPLFSKVLGSLSSILLFVLYIPWPYLMGSGEYAVL